MRGPHLHRERLIVDSATLVTGTVTAGLLGFAFQVVASHRLQPADFGSLFASMSLFTLVTLPASALTLLMARESSRSRAGNRASATALLRSGNRALLMLGVALAGVVALGAVWLGPFLKIPVPIMLAAAASFPTSFAGPLLMGELQGEERFTTLSLLMAGQGALKLAGAFVLGLRYGAVGFMVGLAIASLVAYLVLLRLLRHKLSMRVYAPWFGTAAKYMAIVLPSTLALSLLLSTDILLVKHFFSGPAAGEYAAVGALGRAIFWGASAVAAVLFPKIVLREALGAGGLRIVAISLGLVVIGGVAGLVGLSLGSRLILGGFAGRAYLGGATYLPWYAIAMTLLGCASILIATHQSRARGGFLAILIPVAVGEPMAISAFHQSLMQVVQVVIITMAVLVVALTILLARQLTRGRRVTAIQAVDVAEGNQPPYALVR